MGEPHLEPGSVSWSWESHVWPPGEPAPDSNVGAAVGALPESVPLASFCCTWHAAKGEREGKGLVK